MPARRLAFFTPLDAPAAAAYAIFSMSSPLFSRPPTHQMPLIRAVC